MRVARALLFFALGAGAAGVASSAAPGRGNEYISNSSHFDEIDALNRAKAAAAWYEGEDNALPPARWRFASKPIFETKAHFLGSGSSKTVSKMKIILDGVIVDVVVKSGQRGKKRKSGPGFHNATAAMPHIKLFELERELLYLEYCSGLPGVPLLYGAYFENERFHYIVQQAGKEPVGMNSGESYKPTHLNKHYAGMMRKHPLGVARAWVRVFRSFAGIGGFLLDDFTPRQFVYHLDARGAPEIFLVDGPGANIGPFADFLNARGDGPGNVARRSELAACASDSDCLGTKSYHCCCDNPKNGDLVKYQKMVKKFKKIVKKKHDQYHVCEIGSVGAPEAHGVCGDLGAAPGHCAPTTHAHIHDLGGHRWLLPAIAKSATQHNQTARASLLRDIIRRCTARDPAARVTYDDLERRLDDAISAGLS